MKKSAYIFVLALLFAGVVQFLSWEGFWSSLGRALSMPATSLWTLIGVETPHGYMTQGFLFLGLLFVLQNVLFGPYLELLKERDAQTTDKKAKAEKTRTDAERMMLEYRAAIDQARLKATTERERMALAAEADERDQIKRAKERASQQLASDIAQLEAESARVKPQLSDQVESIAQDILGQVVASASSGRGFTSDGAMYARGEE